MERFAGGHERYFVDITYWSPMVDLPDRYPPYQTCHRRFQQWVHSGVLDKILQALADDLQSVAV
jgi:hypothetical protein